MGRETQGFASMSPEARIENARKAGRRSHEKGTGHEWTSDEAKVAGRKGALAKAANRRRAAKEA